jgi:hypothetical protein
MVLRKEGNIGKCTEREKFGRRWGDGRNIKKNVSNFLINYVSRKFHS